MNKTKKYKYFRKNRGNEESKNTTRKVENGGGGKAILKKRAGTGKRKQQ